MDFEFVEIKSEQVWIEDTDPDSPVDHLTFDSPCTTPKVELKEEALALEKEMKQEILDEEVVNGDGRDQVGYGSHHPTAMNTNVERKDLEDNFFGRGISEEDVDDGGFILPTMDEMARVTVRNTSLSKIRKDGSVMKEANEFECGICSETFIRKASLKSHTKNVHGMDVKFTCAICRKDFSHNSSLKTHMYSAHKNVKFPCAICRKDFCHKSSLDTHMSSAHKNVKFTCAICSKDFSQKNNLKIHMSSVHGNVKFTCEICSKHFSLKENLKMHMSSVHKNIRFTCPICSRDFFRKSYLNIHVSSVHGNGKFTCSICSKAFIQKSSLKVHMSSSHKKC